jgi:hypothetical protein
MLRDKVFLRYNNATRRTGVHVICRSLNGAFKCMSGSWCWSWDCRLWARGSVFARQARIEGGRSSSSGTVDGMVVDDNMPEGNTGVVGTESWVTCGIHKPHIGVTVVPGKSWGAQGWIMRSPRLMRHGSMADAFYRGTRSKVDVVGSDVGTARWGFKEEISLWAKGTVNSSKITWQEVMILLLESSKQW